MLTNKIALLIIFLFSNIENSIGDCIPRANNYFVNDKEKNMLVISNFDRFQDLILDCKEKFNISWYVNFLPNKPILIVKALKWEKIFDKKSLKSIKNLYMSNFKGFDMSTKAVSFQNTTFASINFMYAFSNLDFYMNNTLIEKSDCRREFFNFSQKTFFYSFNYV